MNKTYRITLTHVVTLTSEELKDLREEDEGRWLDLDLNDGDLAVQLARNEMDELDGQDMAVKFEELDDKGTVVATEEW